MSRINNFDAIRLIAAVVVVIGHAWPLTGLPDAPSVATIPIHGLAVFVFFSLSGYLITQSIFVLGTLCPWCMVTWLVAIPGFWVVTLRNLSAGVFTANPRITRIASGLYSWVPTIVLACYLLVAVLAQVRLDVINHI